MGQIVIACYRPKPGKEEALSELMRDHLPILRSQGLVTDLDAITMVAADGTVVEVFEWKSREAVEAAHKNAAVLAMWERYAAVCDYVPVASIAETAELFPHFVSLDLSR